MQEDVKDPLSKLSLREGTKISKTLSRFLRHGMNVGQYCEIDGSIELEELEISIGIKAELILIAVNPAFDQNKKRIFLVTEKIFPGGQTRILVAALVGHISRFLPHQDITNWANNLWYRAMDVPQDFVLGHTDRKIVRRPCQSDVKS